MILQHRKIFYIVRHGQTDDNAAGVISGRRRDPHLTDLGRAQAQDAAHVFARLSPQPSRLVTSALVRTHETAEIITKRRDFIIDPRMDERDLGPLDGQITEEEQILRKTLPEEESVEAQRARVLDSLNDHLGQEEYTLFVCHGGTVRRVLEIAGLKGRAKAHNGIILILSPTDDGWDVSQA